MQNYCKTIGAALAASALVAGTASAEVEYELHTGYTSQYLWRGLNLGQDLVEAGFDVAGKCPLTGLDLSAGAWYGSYDMTRDARRAVLRKEYRVDELDLYAEAAKDFGCLTAAVGYIWYHNEDQVNVLSDAQEIYFSLRRDFGFVNASLTYFWDIETDNNGYSELALSKSFELSPCLSLGIGTAVGYNVEPGDFAAWTTKASLDWAFADRATLSPFVAVAVSLDDSWNNDGDEIVGGTMLSVSF